MKKEQRKPGFFYQTMAETIELIALGSGSRGNSLAVRYGDQTLLVDAGFSCRELKRRLTVSGVDPGSVRAVLLTHEHSDHLSGCRVFCDEFQIPAYISSATADYLYNKKQLPERVVEFISGSDFCLPGVSVTPFSVPHDALDPVGFDFTLDNDCRIAVATDLGCMEKSIACRLYNADILVLEANYDLKMLLESTIASRGMIGLQL